MLLCLIIDASRSNLRTGQKLDVEPVGDGRRSVMRRNHIVGSTHPLLTMQLTRQQAKIAHAERFIVKVTL